MDGVRDVILDVVDRAKASFWDGAMVRIDAGFPSAPLPAGPEARGIDDVSRLKANPVPDRLAEPHMVRPVGRRPAMPRTWLREPRYRAESGQAESGQAESGQAESGDKPRRVVPMVKERADDAARDRFFPVTSLDWTRTLRHEVLGPNLPAKGAASSARRKAHIGGLKDGLAPAFAIVARTNGAPWLLRRPTGRSRTGAARRPRQRHPQWMPLRKTKSGCRSRASLARSCTSPAAPWDRNRDGPEPAPPARAGAAGRRAAADLGILTLALSSAAAPFRSVRWKRIRALHRADPERSPRRTASLTPTTPMGGALSCVQIGGLRRTGQSFAKSPLPNQACHGRPRQR